MPNSGETPLYGPARPGLRTSSELPVWAWVSPAGGHLPLLIDGHMGALPSLPWRLAAALGGAVGGVGSGLLWARGLSIALGLLAMVALFRLTELIAGRNTAWVAALLAASSPHLAFVHHWARPDEQLAGLAPLLAVLAAIRARSGRGTRWWWWCALLFGLGAAAKATSGWLLIAALVAAAAFRCLPPLRARVWVPMLAAFSLPLTAHVAWMVLAPGKGPLLDRLSRLPSPAAAFTDSRIAFFARHFAETVGGLGDFLTVHMTDAPAADAGPPIGGWGMLGACAIVVLSLWARRAPRRARTLGAGVLAVGLLYVGLYYRGMSLFILLAPWVPVAVAVGGFLLWHAVAHRGAAIRRAVGGGLALLLVATTMSQLQQGAQVRSALAETRYPIFDLTLQRRVAKALMARKIKVFWTTTYAEAGVFETLTDGKLRSHNVAAALREHGESTGSIAAAHRRAWGQILATWPAGPHHVLLALDPAEVAFSPLKDGPAIAAALPLAVAERGGTAQIVTSWSGRAGAEVWRLLRVELPAAVR